MLEHWDLVRVLVAGIGTIAIFSFLVKENPYFRFFEHLYIGIAAGFGILLPIKTFIWPTIMVPMLGLDVVQYPDGTLSSDSYDWRLLLFLVPMIFGLFIYFIYLPSRSWLAKLTIGFMFGASGGAAFQGFFNYILPQLDKSFKPLIVAADTGSGIDWYGSFDNMLFVLTLLAVMYYFFFSFRRGEGIARHVSFGGRYLMMVCFGAYFGSTVMARMALLVERIQFLLDDWKNALLQVIT